MQVRDHWWWRPGWRLGRRFYTWHLTFERQEEFRRIAQGWQRPLAGLPGLDLVRGQWLHLTMQGVGFADEVDEGEVERIAAATRERLTRLHEVDLVFGQPVVRAESVVTLPTPTEPVVAIRRAIREAIADVWGLPEGSDGFAPHVSLAYCNRPGPAEPIVAALEDSQPQGVAVRVTQVSLILLGRDEHEYRWQTFATARLGAP